MTPLFRRPRAAAATLWAKVGLALGVSLAPVSHAHPASAEGITLRVHGGARIEARTTREAGDLLLRGVLVDDAGQGLAGATLSARLSRESDPRDAQTTGAVRGARACDATGAARGSVKVAGTAEAPELALVTDEAGRFCARATLDPDRYAATLAWSGSPLVLGTESRITFDSSRQALTLRFDPSPSVVGLDAARASFEVVALVDESGVTAVARGLAVTLTDERGTALGEDTTDATGRAHFTVDTSRLGPPGRGELRAAFVGSTDVAFAKEVITVERRATVTVRAPDHEPSSVGAIRPKRLVPDDGIPIRCDVATVKGAVSEGAVEARLGDTVVGAAPVERGVAHVVATFSSEAEEAEVRLRYVPSSPWLRSEGETMITLPIAPPPLWSKAPVLAAGLAVLVVFLLGRFTASATKPKPTPLAAEHSEVEQEARVDVVAVETTGARVWRGRVIDAHERTPLAGAHVWIERGTFDGKTVVATAKADAEGRFELAPPDSKGFEGEGQLGAEARLHARHLQPLPKPGELSVALVARRRAVLGRLVAWARNAGAPFDAKPEPTPGHVRRAAARSPEAAHWAAAVERAAFDHEEVDANVEAAVDRLRPEKANIGVELGVAAGADVGGSEKLPVDRR